MRTKITFSALLLAVAASVIAADFTMRPGRWEVSAQMEFPGRELPRDMPLGKPMSNVECITADEVQKLQVPMPLPDQNCTLSNYKESGAEISYTAHCPEDGEEIVIDYRITIHSPDFWSGETESHGADPSQSMIMKFEARRTSDDCSAAELEEDE